MSVTSLLAIALGAILTNNFILVKFLGICPFMGVSKKTDTAIGMGIAVTFVMTIASMATWLVNRYLLVPLELGYMQTAAFILIIAAIVQLVEMFLKKSVPALYQAPGHLPAPDHHQLRSAGRGASEHSGGLQFPGIFRIRLLRRPGLHAGHCAVLRRAAAGGGGRMPECFRGFPIALISAGLLALAFMGFSGMHIFD